MNNYMVNDDFNYTDKRIKYITPLSSIKLEFTQFFVPVLVIYSEFTIDHPKSILTRLRTVTVNCQDSTRCSGSCTLISQASNNKDKA